MSTHEATHPAIESCVCHSCKASRKLSPLMRDALTRCWCDAKGAWFVDIGGGGNYLCDEHKIEAEKVPENAGVEFHPLRLGNTNAGS